MGLSNLQAAGIEGITKSPLQAIGETALAFGTTGPVGGIVTAGFNLIQMLSNQAETQRLNKEAKRQWEKEFALSEKQFGLNEKQFALTEKGFTEGVASGARAEKRQATQTKYNVLQDQMNRMMSMVNNSAALKQNAIQNWRS